MDHVQLTEPLTPQARLDAVSRALQASDTDRAIILANQALDAGVEHPLLLNLSAYGYELQGRLDEALNRLTRALALAPADVLILTSIATTLSQQARYADALAYFDAALAVHANHAPALNGRGAALVLTGELEEGRRQHLRASELDPNYPDPLGALADLAMRDLDTDRAKMFAQRALALDPRQPAATVVMAAIESKAGDHAAALARVDALLKGNLSPLHRAAAEHLKANELDKLDRPLEAFDAYLDANRSARIVHAPIFEQPNAETGTQLAKRLKLFFDDATPSDWAADKAKAVPGPCREHVFLFGFVRSGTTLLEQVLASHPDVVALEEKLTLRALIESHFSTNDGLKRLAHLSEEEAEPMRADYWRRVRSFGVEPAGKVFVDKEPLSSLWLPMVAKLFPKAKILFAVRDPRDVVLSSFRHRFVVQALTYDFTDLEGAANFYASVMDVTDVFRKLLNLDFYQHRHEDLVMHFDDEVQRICDFLGLEFNVAMRDFAETAKRRDVRTPSAEQVRRGLFSEGMGRWRRYGPKTAPMLPILQPWMERFGYSADEVTTPKS